ncbi:hypothetical protein ASG75_00250 [Rhodanobacter sp. Soil772]|uniref:hypothetical protein n=1 Tax=Rhodanobacter sp. Soil772 TaxID=1736406 RepID=UPI0006F24A2B|nr:hypothetical protein [Rhodanobacter sp. Soil772]KRE86655.1 hypothetical protein ASG75_00250 [Rhodanobacter sp. Soil772]
MHLLNYVAMIPNVVWAAILASALTFFGVMLSNRSNTSRLIKTLAHESSEKDKDRIHSLRKDVYLRAAETMAEVGNYLGKIPQLDPTKENIADGLSGFFGASIKLQLVAESGTAKLANELTARYTEMLFSLLAKASPVHTLQASIQIAGEFYDQKQSEVVRVLAEMTQLNESGSADPLRFEALKRSFDNSQQAATQLSEDRIKSFEERNLAMREYTIALLKEMRSVGPLQMRLTAAIRGELALATEASDYEAEAQANFERIDRSMKELLATLEKG